MNYKKIVFFVWHASILFSAEQKPRYVLLPHDSVRNGFVVAIVTLVPDGSKEKDSGSINFWANQAWNSNVIVERSISYSPNSFLSKIDPHLFSCMTSLLRAYKGSFPASISRLKRVPNFIYSPDLNLFDFSEALYILYKVAKKGCHVYRRRRRRKRFSKQELSHMVSFVCSYQKSRMPDHFKDFTAWKLRDYRESDAKRVEFLGQQDLLSGFPPSQNLVSRLASNLKFLVLESRSNESIMGFLSYCSPKQETWVTIYDWVALGPQASRALLNQALAQWYCQGKKICHCSVFKIDYMGRSLLERFSFEPRLSADERCRLQCHKRKDLLRKIERGEVNLEKCETVACRFRF